MSEVKVKAIQPVLGLDDGAVVTIERTPRVDVAIKTGRLVVLEEVRPDDIAVVATIDEVPPIDDVLEGDTEPEASKAKRVKKLAGGS